MKDFRVYLWPNPRKQEIKGQSRSRSQARQRKLVEDKNIKHRMSPNSPQKIFSYIYYVTHTETIKSPDKPLDCFLLIPLKQLAHLLTDVFHCFTSCLVFEIRIKFLMQYSSKNDPSHFMDEENTAQPSYAGSRVLWGEGWARGLSLKNLMLLETWLQLPEGQRMEHFGCQVKNELCSSCRDSIWLMTTTLSLTPEEKAYWNKEEVDHPKAGARPGVQGQKRAGCCILPFHPLLLSTLRAWEGWAGITWLQKWKHQENCPWQETV